MAVSEQKKTNQAILTTLRELGGKGVSEEDIVHEGTRFILPAKLTNEQSVEFLQKKIKEDEQKTVFARTFKYRPWDGANATLTALKRVFGMVGSQSSFNFFGENPPAMITIEVGPNETKEVPWGILTLPILPGAKIKLGADRDPELGTLFQLQIEGPRKYRFEAEGIFKVIQNELETASIYRGKAIDGAEMPSFLDLGGVDPRKVTYSEEVIRQLEANIWVLMERSADMRRKQLPLKRAVLVEGPYGTGKTLAAFLTAQRATANKWTFLYARPGKDDLSEVMRTARLYQPAVVFMEDMDVVEGAGYEDASDNKDKVSEMLDLFDGINAKGTEIVAVLTTNHPEKITQAMLRPGRLDAVIHIGPLDRSGIERLIRANLDKAHLAPDADFDRVSDHMIGFMPAFVKEAGDRAFRYALARGEDVDGIILTTDDLIAAAEGLRPQLELMEKDREAKEDTLESAMRKTVKSASNGHEVQESLDKIMDEMGISRR